MSALTRRFITTAILAELKTCAVLFACGAIAGLVIGLMVNVMRGAL